MPAPATPLFGLRLRCRDVALRSVREEDLPHLADILPDDYELNPRAELLSGLDVAENRRRTLCQDYWRALGTSSPTAWCLNFAVEYGGDMVGVQTLEANDFPTVRTVDSASWLVWRVRGRGIGVAMRMAVLGLAFDHLHARAAITSARTDNGPSLGVSRRIGYVDNGVSLNASHQGAILLSHLRLTEEAWSASGLGREVTVEGLAPCLPWFGAKPDAVASAGGAATGKAQGAPPD
jgi:RimJ/RimL family protein N-acetyltransferase